MNFLPQYTLQYMLKNKKSLVLSAIRNSTMNSQVKILIILPIMNKLCGMKPIIKFGASFANVGYFSRRRLVKTGFEKPRLAMVF